MKSKCENLPTSMGRVMVGFRLVTSIKQTLISLKEKGIPSKRVGARVGGTLHFVFYKTYKRKENIRIGSPRSPWAKVLAVDADENEQGVGGEATEEAAGKEADGMEAMGSGKKGVRSWGEEADEEEGGKVGIEEGAKKRREEERKEEAAAGKRKEDEEEELWEKEERKRELAEEK